MEPGPANASQVINTFARRVVAVGESRSEMLMVEVQEARDRLLRALLLALGVGQTRFPRRNRQYCDAARNGSLTARVAPRGVKCRQRVWASYLISSLYNVLMVEGSGIGYLKTVCDYVNLNPVRGSSLLPSEPIQKNSSLSLSACAAMAYRETLTASAVKGLKTSRSESNLPGNEGWSLKSLLAASTLTVVLAVPLAGCAFGFLPTGQRPAVRIRKKKAGTFVPACTAQ